MSTISYPVTRVTVVVDPDSVFAGSNCDNASPPCDREATLDALSHELVSELLEEFGKFVNIDIKFRSVAETGVTVDRDGPAADVWPLCESDAQRVDDIVQDVFEEGHFWRFQES